MSNKLVVCLQNITKSYEKKVVIKDLSLDVAAGELIMIFGESGVGKSTILNIIALIDKPTSGTYFLNGEEVCFNDDRQLSILRNTKIGIVFQMYHLIPKLTVKENIFTPLLYSKKKNNKKFKENYDILINKLKLEHLQNRLIDKLSGGEKQRVAIARALMTNPSLVVCDEPTGNLDNGNSQIIMAELKEITKNNQTVIIVSHDRTLQCYADKSYELKEDCLVKL